MQRQNLVKLIRDPKEYLERFCRIKGKVPGLQRFILNEAQKDLFNTLNRSFRVIILKARQIGFSTAVTGYFYHKAITTPGINVALIGYNSDLTAELLDKVKTFFNTTPEALRPRVKYNSKYEISFPALDSKILVLPSSENVGRGYTLHGVLCTELAFWDKPEEKMLAIENSVPHHGKIVIESTPNGVGNLFHRMWMSDNGYEKKEYGWWWHYSEKEIEIIKRRINNPRRFAQEYGLEFLSSGRPVFDMAIVNRLRDFVLNVGDEVEIEGGGKFIVKQMSDGVRMYKPPYPGGVYVLGADVAEGVSGGDYSVMTIWDRKKGEEVAMFRGHIPADRFGALVYEWGIRYNSALAVVEINNHGLTTVTTLRNMGYPQIYFRPTKFDVMGTRWSERMGWRTTKVTRPLMIDDFAEALRDESLIIHSKETLDEMLTFVYDDSGNMVCNRGYHDDCIFSSAIAFQGFKVICDRPLVQIDESQHLPNSTPY